ncbi:hypothetical protein PRUPE_2G090900 [Prunus persica]|uniref:Uncharacterized protein n=1 Tax=Prunus persica TaxID=3760 RepID=M5X8B0_PRUPE|nr:hypothetical protein PRUPE_4G246400 [Prunus persica]ONI21816.1 hypothetical protein PRUPE_2G090900 [Prunus persica]
MELQFMNCLCWAVQNECFFKWPQHPGCTLLPCGPMYVWLLVLGFCPRVAFMKVHFSDFAVVVTGKKELLEFTAQPFLLL